MKERTNSKGRALKDGGICTSYIDEAKRQKDKSATPRARTSEKDGELKFDRRNYRIHDDRNKRLIGKSLKEYGAGRSILADSEGEIIAGNGVFEQAQKLGIPTRIVETDGSELVVVKRTDLKTSDNKRRGLALADNATSDTSAWDANILAQDWSEEELSEWGVELPEDEGLNTAHQSNGNVFDYSPQFAATDTDFAEADTHDRKEHREATWAIDNFNIFNTIPAEEVTDLGFPIIRPIDYCPKNGMIPFSEMLAAKDAFAQGIHFFVDDYRFQRVWNSPESYDERLTKHDFVVMPDFSTYSDMPVVMQMWNKFRNHLLAWHWQSLGMKVIPNVMFNDESSFEWVFDGLPKNATVCLSNVGVMQKKEWRDAFMRGMEQAIRVLCPKRIIFYGRTPAEYDFGEIETVEIRSTSFRHGGNK